MAADRPSVTNLPPWSLKLAIHYLPPATNHSQYDVVLAWPGQAWFLGGTNVAGAGKPKAERIKNGVPESTDLPTGAHSWITAASAPSRDDIWAVTFLGGSVLNWNGSAWKTEPRGGVEGWHPLHRHHGDQCYRRLGVRDQRDGSTREREPGTSQVPPGSG